MPDLKPPVAETQLLLRVIQPATLAGHFRRAGYFEYGGRQWGILPKLNKYLPNKTGNPVRPTSNIAAVISVERTKVAAQPRDSLRDIYTVHKHRNSLRSDQHSGGCSDSLNGNKPEVAYSYQKHILSEGTAPVN